MLKSYLLVFFVSMVPLIELRGAIPIGLRCLSFSERMTFSVGILQSIFSAGSFQAMAPSL